MGLIDFVQSAGRKTGLFGTRSDPAVEAAKAAAATAVAAARSNTDTAVRHRAVAADIEAAILSNVPVQSLAVTFDGTVATVTGKTRTQADAEKAVLVAGNTEGVARVSDQLVVELPEKPARFHTVVKGDTLSTIAARYYGVMRMFDAVFVANQPMLTSPDLIYPGQVLRIPPVQAPTHTVAAGETLGTIAKHWYGEAGRYTEIASANQLANPDQVAVGQKLVIPLVHPQV